MPKTDVVVVKRIRLGGEDRLDIRRYVRNGDGELKPTRRGLSLSPDLSEEIIQALREADLHETEIEL